MNSELDGLKLGCIALSSACHPDLMARSKKFFQQIGVAVEIGLNPSEYYGRSDFMFSSDDPVKRAEKLHEFAQDPDIAFILSARGGSGSLELLPLLDFDHLRKFKKPLVGFSDTTALSIALYQDAGWPCVHGPVFGSFDTNNFAELKAHWNELVQLLSRKTTKLLGGHPLRLICGELGEGVSGRLVGGNLSLLATLLGTPWAPELSDAILFFEEVGEAPYRLHRMLTQFALAKRFDTLKAVLVGELLKCEHSKGEGPTSEEVIRHIFEPLGIPVLIGSFFGHGKLNYPLPLGLQAKVSQSKQLELA